jgi:hypothetical protein
MTREPAAQSSTPHRGADTDSTEPMPSSLVQAEAGNSEALSD